MKERRSFVLLTRPRVDCKVGNHGIDEMDGGAAPTFHLHRTLVLISQLVINFRKDKRHLLTNHSAIKHQIQRGTSTVFRPTTDVGAGVDGSTWLVARLIAA